MRGASRFFSMTILGAALCLTGCQKDPPLPELSTIGISNIFDRSAQSGGTVSKEGDSHVTARGVCWSTSKGPTIDDSKTTDGKGPGRFESFVTGLSTETEYHVRAYATNSSGTAYGDEVTFKTLATTPILVSGTISDQQGHYYETKEIGGKTWMTENLRVQIFADGSHIPFERTDAWNILTTPACCWVQNDDSWTVFYGQLYNFYAASDPRNLCPTGWHVPSVDEWRAMIDSLGGNTMAGGKLKEMGTNHWITPNAGANNGSGFTGLAAGIRNVTGYDDFKAAGYFWTSSSADDKLGNIQMLRYSSADAFSAKVDKVVGASVRCVKN